MRRLFFAVLFIPSIAAAQSPAPVDPVHLVLSRAHVQAIGNLLLEAPYRVASPILETLAAQIKAVDTPPPPAPAPPAADKPPVDKAPDTPAPAR